MSGVASTSPMLDQSRNVGADRASAFFICVAAVLIGLAIQNHDGEYTPMAMLLITIALIAGVLAIVRPRRMVEALSGRALNLAIGIGLAIEVLELFRSWPLSVDQKAIEGTAHSQFIALLASGALMIAVGFFDVKWPRRWWFPALLVLNLATGFWMIHASPEPHIDVWVFQQQGPKTLLEGHNPYDYRQANFPDIYHSARPGAQEVYGPGLSKDDRLQFGFPYPPLSLLLATIGYGIAHDHRYAQAIAITMAGLFIGYARPGRFAKLAAALFLMTPRIWFVLGRGWTEPFVVMLLAATIFCCCRNLWKLLPIALGFFLASKQYLAIAVPFTFLLLQEPFNLNPIDNWKKWGWLLIKSALVAAIVSLPLALWNWHEFWFSTVSVQKYAPFRWDALSYLVMLGLHNSRYITWTWLVPVTLIPVMFLAFRKAPRSAAGFALSLGLVFLVFFAFNKQAFCNYYFFTIGAFCCALGAMPITSPAAAEGLPRYAHSPSAPA